MRTFWMLGQATLGVFTVTDAAQALPADQYEAACDHAIATCNGDLRGAVKALIVANEFLERDLQQLRAAVSSGYLRQRLNVDAT